MQLVRYTGPWIRCKLVRYTGPWQRYEVQRLIDDAAAAGHKLIRASDLEVTPKGVTTKRQ